MKTLDNFVKRSEKKIREETKILICEKPLSTYVTTLNATAH